MTATQTRSTTHTTDHRPQSDSPPPNGRSSDGRFAKGNGFGLGNPFYRKQAEFRRAALELFTPEDVMSLLRVMLALGRQGDVAAAKVFLEYVVGKPHQAPDPDREEHHEWQLQAEAPRLGQVTELLDRAVPPDMAADALRDTLPEAAYDHLCNVFAARNGTPPTEPPAATPAAEEPPPAEQAAEPTASQRSREALRILTATLRAAVANGENGEAVERCRQVIARLTGDDGGTRTVPTADDGHPPAVSTADDGGGRGAGPGPASQTGPDGAPGPRVL
jgi:hypothetical protein